MKHLKIRSLFAATEVFLCYKNKVAPKDRIKVSEASTAYDIFINAWDMNKIELVEHSMMLGLDVANNCLGISLISTGSISNTQMDPKIVFLTALKLRASKIILAHNHPSGELRPSRQDVLLTQKLIEGGKYLDINVADHLIVSRRGYSAFSENGWYQYR